MTPRWHTFEPGIEHERIERERIVTAIDSWWRQFEARRSDIAALFKRQTQWDLAGWMLHNLQSVDPRLMWEYGPGLVDGHRLVITPENQYQLRPLVDEVLRRAPKLNAWSFYGHRLAESLETASATVEARTGAELAATGFRCEPARFNLIDLTIEFPRKFLREDGELAFSQAFILVESLLGESSLNTWVGAIEAGKKSWRSKGLQSLADTAQQTVRGLVEQLPEKPLFQSPDGLWSLLKVEPAPVENYPAQTDIFLGKALNTELWQNAHSGVRFYSPRYSRAGEVFCYLKMDGSEGLEGEVFQDKSEVEDALDERLRSAGVGCFIGGGTGLRYSYVDLAITDLERALSLVREVLQAGKLTKRSWLQFYDTESEYEWYGIWPDSPPPPMPTERA